MIAASLRLGSRQALLDNATPVAVKFVTNQSFKEQERFKREVNILKSLRHINIVQFLGATVTNDKIMLVTEARPTTSLSLWDMSALAACPRAAQQHASCTAVASKRAVHAALPKQALARPAAALLAHACHCAPLRAADRGLRAVHAAGGPVEGAGLRPHQPAGLVQQVMLPRSWLQLPARLSRACAPDCSCPLEYEKRQARLRCLSRAPSLLLLPGCESSRMPAAARVPKRTCTF